MSVSLITKLPKFREKKERERERWRINSIGQFISLCTPLHLPLSLRHLLSTNSSPSLTISIHHLALCTISSFYKLDGLKPIHLSSTVTSIAIPLLRPLTFPSFCRQLFTQHTHKLDLNISTSISTVDKIGRPFFLISPPPQDITQTPFPSPHSL